MKKRIALTILVTIFILCGCAKKWEKTVQISNLKIEDDYIVGRIKNLKDKAYNIRIHIKAKSGSLTEDRICTELIKPYETIDLECLSLGLDDSYELKISDVTLNEYDIPKLAKGKIDIETFKYHFDEIYDTHTLNFAGFTVANDRYKYPYIDEIEYDGTKISISGTIDIEDYYFAYGEEFDAYTNNLKHMHFYILKKAEFDDKFDRMLVTISLMPMLSDSSIESRNIYNALKRTDVKEGYCVKVGNWCISPEYSEESNSNEKKLFIFITSRSER